MNPNSPTMKVWTTLAWAAALLLAGCPEPNASEVVPPSTPYCWGDNERGQLGFGSADVFPPDVLPHPRPMPVSTGVTFASITAGLGRHSCGRTALGAAYCWGENTFGALGNGTQEDSAIPVEVAGGRTFSQLIAGGFLGHTCALTGTGDAYCWGENEPGQVGDGTTVDRLAPTAVFGGLIFTSIDAGFRHTCGRDNTGALYCWGANGAGQLGNNTNTLSSVPSKVFGQPSEPSAVQIAATSFSSVYAGGAHTCALTAAGNAFCWGRGESGQLGVPAPTTICQLNVGPFPCSMIPIPVGTELGFVRLALGGAHTCGLLSDGTAFCWGNNASGQLGDGTTTNRDRPVPVLTGLKFTSIDAGAAHTCALTSAGEAYCWGRNDRGQLGDGTIVDRLAPAPVFGFTFQQIAAGGFAIGHTCGLATTGQTVLGLQLNQTLFHPGDTMVLTAMLTPGTAPALVDAYVVIQLPDGTLLSLQPVGAVPGIAPFATGFTPPPFSGTIFIYQFTGAEPPGPYSWFAALTQAGTLNVVGSIDQDPFTFSP